MGTEIYATHTLTGNFTIFSSIIGAGIAVATTALIGQNIGAGNLNTVKKCSFLAMVTTSVSMTVIMLIITVLLIDLFAQPSNRNGNGFNCHITGRWGH